MSTDGKSDIALSSSRMLAILSLFNVDRLELGVSEVARELDLSKASVSRFLATLEQANYVEQDPVNRRFTLGPELLRLGNLFAPFGRIQELARPLMQQLVMASGFTAYLSMRRRSNMIILAAREGAGPIRYSIPVGYSLPVHCSATGKAALSCLPDQQLHEFVHDLLLDRRTDQTITDPTALIAHLQSVRARGYSVNWEENTPGVGSVAAAVVLREPQNPIVLSLGFATSQVSREGCELLGLKVRAASDALLERVVEGEKGADLSRSADHGT